LHLLADMSVVRLGWRSGWVARFTGARSIVAPVGLGGKKEERRDRERKKVWQAGRQRPAPAHPGPFVAVVHAKMALMW